MKMSTSINFLFPFSAILFVMACSDPKPEKGVIVSRDSSLVLENKDTHTIAESNESLNEERLKPQEIKIDDYTFTCGYEKYDEDKYGFSNPGYLEIRKNGNVIFKDTFEGEGETYVKSLGHHDLSGDKLFFTLNWGTEACDYSQESKYYFITPAGKVSYLKDYWSGSGGDGYASRYYEHIFPEDSAGMPYSLLIVEGMIFHEHDQPDRSDTTYVSFDKDTYKMNKPTDNLAKVK
jgi:hypothetical protein